MEQNKEKIFYTAIEVQKILELSRSRVYIFLDEVYRRGDPFKIIKVGKLYRVQKKSFDNWLNGEV